MRILGISSATSITSIGLIDGERVLAETTLSAVASEKIMFYVKEAGIKPEDIQGVAVAAGPGSYSGLRGGIATAKSLAQSLNIPLAGVSTLEAIAYNLINMEGTMAAILDARLDEYSFALFGASGGTLKRLTGDLVIRLDLLAAKLGKISGEIWLIGKTGEIKQRKELAGKNFHFVPEADSLPLGLNVAKLGAIKIQSGQIDDPLKLFPNYSHMPPLKEFK